MGNHSTGGIGYVDDLTLLTPTKSGLKALIEICEKYADDYCVKFNLILFLEVGSDNRAVVCIVTELQSVQDAVHLGHHVLLIRIA